MAWTASAWFRAFFTEALGNTTAYDLSGAGVDTFRNALFNNTPTPSKDVTQANSAYNVDQWGTANEVYEAGQWAQAGVALSSPAISNPSGGRIMFDATDTASGSAADLANVYGCLIYDDTLSDYGVCYNYLGGANSVVNGTFTVVYDTDGIAYVAV